MIYTRFGTPVVAVRDYDPDTGEISAKREGRVTYDLRCHITELKADGGLSEILAQRRYDHAVRSDNG